MANLGNTYPDDQPQPATDSGASAPRPMSSAQHAHFKELAGHLIDNATAVGHGHLVGENASGRMPANNSHKQAGATIRPRALDDGTAKMPQSDWSDGAGCASASDSSTADYGAVR